MIYLGKTLYRAALLRQAMLPRGRALPKEALNKGLRWWRGSFLLVFALLLASCTSQPVQPQTDTYADQRNEIVLYSLSLLDRGYKFGGSNPESGLDCSGMVSFIYDKAAKIRLPHNARQIAAIGNPIKASELRPGDLVFFKIDGVSFAHVGIYLGDDKFIHANKHNGSVRTDLLSSRYFHDRLEAARTFF
jgi:cell wall-associated NlpC family hydrolase